MFENRNYQNSTTYSHNYPSSSHHFYATRRNYAPTQAPEYQHPVLQVSNLNWQTDSNMAMSGENSISPQDYPPYFQHMESNILSTNVMQQDQNMFPRLPSAQTLLINNPNISACDQFSPQPAHDSADWTHIVDNTYSFVHQEENDHHYEGLSYNTSSSLSPTSWFSGSPSSIPNDPFLHSPIHLPAQNVHSPQIPSNRPNIQRLIKGRVIKLVKILKLPAKGEGSKKGTIGRPRGPSKQAQASAQVGGVAKKAHQVKPKANDHNNEYHRYYAFDKYALTMLKMLQACKTTEDKTEMVKILEEEQGIIAIEDSQSMPEIKDGEELIETTLYQLAVNSTGKRVVIKDRNK